jgi:hypothetical protein
LHTSACGLDWCSLGPMNGEDELPEYLRQRVQTLRARGPSQERVVERLLERRASGSAEERRQVDEMIIALSKPSRVGVWIGVGALVVAGIAAASFISDRSHAAAVAAGTKTVAQVTRLDDADCAIGERRSQCLRLTLQVHPVQDDAYVALLTHDIPTKWLSRVQPGSWLTVAVDPHDRTKVHFDEPSLALPPPSPPRR